MSVPVGHTDRSLAVFPQSTVVSNWTTNASEIRTIKVSNVSLSASERDIREFFSFSGDIQYLEIQRETESTQVVYVTFKDVQGADTARLLTGALIGDFYVNITPAEDYQLPPEALSTDMDKKWPVTDSAVRKAEDVVSTMLAKGFVLGKDAINKAKVFDEQHHLTSNASATVASIDRKIGLSEKLSFGTAVVSEKMREINQWYQVTERTKSAFAVAEQKASDAGSAVMNNRYVSAGATWVLNAFNAVSRTAEDVSTMTKEKVVRAEEERNEMLYKERTAIIDNFAHIHLDDYLATGPPVVPVHSTDNKPGII